MSTVKVGMTALLSESAAALPLGRETKDQLYVSASPSTSLEALPSRATVSPTNATWFAPAFATGGVFAVLITTVSAVLSTLPSLTMSCAT